jgi:hypothetical protein
VAVTAATAEQLADLRADLADTAASPAFSDDDLERLWQRAGGRHERACYLAVRQLLMQANRFHDYMLGQGATDQKKSQVRKHLADMLEVFAAAGGASASGGSGLGSLRLDTATTEYDPDDEDDE